MPGVQSILSNLAKDNRTSVELDTLLVQGELYALSSRSRSTNVTLVFSVRSSIERDGLTPGTWDQFYVNHALQQEVFLLRITHVIVSQHDMLQARARRIVVEKESSAPLVTLSQRGQHLCGPLLHSPWCELFILFFFQLLPPRSPKYP